MDAKKCTFNTASAPAAYAASTACGENTNFVCTIGSEAGGSTKANTKATVTKDTAKTCIAACPAGTTAITDWPTTSAPAKDALTIVCKTTDSCRYASVQTLTDTDTKNAGCPGTGYTPVQCKACTGTGGACGGSNTTPGGANTTDETKAKKSNATIIVFSTLLIALSILF